MMGFFLTLRDFEPMVVKITTGRPSSVLPSVPSVDSYRATWLRIRSMGLGSYSPSNNSCAPDGALLSVISCLLLESPCLSCLRDAVATTRNGLDLVAGRSRSMDCSDIMLCSKDLS